MAITNNVSSIQTNQSFLNQTAANLKKERPNLTKGMTNLVVAEKTNAVNVTAIKAQDEMLGSLLDLKA